MRLKGEYEVRTAPGPARRGALHRAAAAQSRHIPSAVAAVAKRRGGANADAEAKAVLWSAGQTPRGEAAAR